MALDSYANLKTAISAWVERQADTDYVSEVDTFIDMAEARFSRVLVGHHELEGNSTLTTDANGEATLPSDYMAYKTAIWDGSFDRPMDYVNWGQLQFLNQDNTAGVPNRFSIRSSTLKVGPIAAGDILLTYSARISALTNSNTSNWLLVAAPDAYLMMCLGAGHLFRASYQEAAAAEGKALSLLEEVGIVGNMAQFANAGQSAGFVTP